MGLYERSRVSWECRSRWASGIHLGCLPMATQQLFCGAERLKSNMAASACWLQWATSHQSSQESFLACSQNQKEFPLPTSQMVWVPSPRCQLWDGDKLSCTVRLSKGLVQTTGGMDQENLAGRSSPAPIQKRKKRNLLQKSQTAALQLWQSLECFFKTVSQ